MKERGTGLLCAAPLPDKSAKSVQTAFLHHYIGYYGVPTTVITDNGREFTAGLFRDFCECHGIQQKFVTACHPAANGIVERVHRCIRAAFRALPNPEQWASQLPLLILTLNNVTCDVNQYSAFQQTFGQPANLPGALIFPDDSPTESPVDWFHTAAFVEIMGHHHREARPLPDNKPYIEKALDSCTRVWVRNNAPKHSLSPLYNGPFDVVARHDKYFTIDHGGYLDNITVDRLKAFFEFPPPTAQQDDVLAGLAHSDEAEIVEDVQSHPYNVRRRPRPDYVAMNG